MQTIIPSASGRIDACIAKELGVSRSFASVLLDQGKVSIDGTTVFKPSTKVSQTDSIHINYEPVSTNEIPEVSLPILYEDNDCLVIDKPAGVLTHSKGAFNPEATVSTFIRPHTQDLDTDRGGIVHRLDRVTSGVIICAKTPTAMSWLQKQFSERKAKKTYVAVVQGSPNPSEAIIDMPIERNPKKPQTFRVGVNGKPAKTQYHTLKTTPELSLIELRPETGRTHQLRVHMAYMGCPILGDELYGGKPAKRTYLHAHKLDITLPNKQHKVFTSPVPPAFEEIFQHE